MPELTPVEPSLRTLIEVLSAVSRVKARTATAVALHFLTNRKAWDVYKRTMDAIDNLGWCLCGNIPLNADETYNGQHLCEFCRQPARNAILIVPDVATIYRVEDLSPDTFWYHVVSTDDDQVMTANLQHFVNNFTHKTGVLGSNPRIFNGLGNDENSINCMSVINDIITEDLGIDSTNLLKSLPVGIAIGKSLSDADDRTLMTVLARMGV